jgi:decaprenyl-phosphate phosphoribosyltransferase
MIEYLKIARPDHWLKNIFILFGHVVAVALGAAPWLGSTSLAWAAYSLVPACLIASANYILNEILDAPYDALHPTKCQRGIPAGKVKVGRLWILMAALIVAGFGLSFWSFNLGYTIALGLLLLSGIVYNIPPIRLKDRAFQDVIAESFNNPIRLWLGWWALAPWPGAWPPLSIVCAWWAFGALLMTGKRYAEFRFIGDKERSGNYRKSFSVYTENSLIIAMITYATSFCFFAGVAMSIHPPLRSQVLVFPFILWAIVAYFRHAMSEVGARLEPEQLMRNPWIIISTIVTAALSLFLLCTDWPVAEWCRMVSP